MKRNFIRLLAACLLLFAMPALLAMDAPKDRAYYEKRGDILWEVRTNSKVIALTFDDGPDPFQTPQILDLLKEYEAKATFFVVGNRVQKFPDLLKREIAEGHEIANHTFYHPYFNRNQTSTKIEQEILLTQEAIMKIGNIRPTLFRPPGGYYNETLVNTARRNGYNIVLWSWHQDTLDWRSPGVDYIVNKVLNNARNGDIVLLHDHVEKRGTNTIQALKKILPELKSRGYQIVTVSELMTYTWN
ncbi:polysaccharide deacetylase family protein [Paenibacillus sp. KN14-4R]|uniref:polysaccharide deacetylase family protein n=1 Tax=Paenibacillus sp. KN14-4R TaxID=3445773 RepID=UPI003F9EF142